MKMAMIMNENGNENGSCSGGALGVGNKIDAAQGRWRCCFGGSRQIIVMIPIVEESSLVLMGGAK